MSIRVNISDTHRISDVPIRWAYSGAHVARQVYFNARTYMEIACTGSGVFSFTGSGNCYVCLVGGGGRSSAPESTATPSGGPGGAGAYLYNHSFAIDDATQAAFAVEVGLGAQTVGAVTGAGASKFGALTTDTVGTEGDGGTGGGGGGNLNANRGGAGDGILKYPYGDTVNFASPHCGGGGGGGWYASGSSYCNGGAGGTNGGGGTDGTPTGYAGGAGGILGGGAGGNGGSTNAACTPGGDATTYGSGGGGGGGRGILGSAYRNRGGEGYQGIVYIRILKSTLAE